MLFQKIFKKSDKQKIAIGFLLFLIFEKGYKQKTVLGFF